MAASRSSTDIIGPRSEAGTYSVRKRAVRSEIGTAITIAMMAISMVPNSGAMTPA